MSTWDPVEQPTWQDLAQRFRSLERSLRSTSLDVQWGDDGHFWRLAGLTDRTVQRQFEEEARTAGNKLSAALRADDHTSALVLEERDPTLRWYKALQHLGSGFELTRHGDLYNTKKEKVGTIHCGTIHAPATASANLCVEFSTKYPEPGLFAPPPMRRRSPNESMEELVTPALPEVLTVLRDTIRSRIPADDQPGLIEAIDAMQAAVGMKDFIERYEAFTSVASNHRTTLPELTLLNVLAATVARPVRKA